MKMNEKVATILSIIVGLLIAGGTALVDRDSVAASLSAGKTGGADYRTGAASQPAPEQGKAMEKGKGSLPGHAGFCPNEGDKIGTKSGPTRGKVVSKKPSRGHGGFLAPGERC